MRQLLAASAAAALTGCVVSTSPVSAAPQKAEVIAEQIKSYLLGKGRAELMTFCDLGRKSNYMGVSYWDYYKRQARKASGIAKGFSPAELEGWDAGQAEAMAQVCPEVK